MSKFKKGLTKRVMAIILSGTMVMSNMTAFASEAPTDVGGYVEEVADDITDDKSADQDDVDEKATEDTATEETVKSEDDTSDGKDDAVDNKETTVETVEATETEVEDEEQASEMGSSLSAETEEDESTETETAETEDEDVKADELQAMESGQTYVLNANDMTVAKNVNDDPVNGLKEGTTLYFAENHFAVLCGNSSVVDGNRTENFYTIDTVVINGAEKKLQAKKENFSKRFAPGGNPNTTKQSVKFITSDAVDVTVYWMSKGTSAAPRQMSILDENGKTKVTTDEITIFKNSLYISTMTLDDAGTYYLGGNNYIYKVMVEPKGTRKENSIPESIVSGGKITWDFSNKEIFPEMIEDNTNGLAKGAEGCLVKYCGLEIDGSKNDPDVLGTQNATLGKFYVRSDDNVQVNQNTVIRIPIDGRSNVTITMWGADDGCYTVDGKKVGSEKTTTFPCNGENGYATFIMLKGGNYLQKIEVEKITPVAVSGKVDIGTSVPEGLEVIFTDTKDSNSVIHAPIGSDGTYSTTLYEGSTYKIEFSDTSLEVSEPESKTVTVGSIPITDLNIKTSALDVETVTGSIVFSDNKCPSDLEIVFTSLDGNHTPPVKLENDGYSVSLEKTKTYKITATGTGIKDYDYTSELGVSSPDKTITFTPKTTYPVTIEVKSFQDGLDISASDITFTDTTDDKYKYSAKVGSGKIDLRNGTYSVAISPKVEYPYYFICPNLTVEGEQNYKYTLDFKERLVWDFTIGDPALEEGKVSEGKTDDDQFYNGLYVNTKLVRDADGNIIQENGKNLSGKFGVNIARKYVQVNKTTLVKIPVSGRGTVAIEPATGTYTLKRLADKDQDASDITAQSPGTITYNEQTKYILMEATTGTVYLTKIIVNREPAVEVSGNITTPEGFDISNYSVYFVNQTDDSKIPVEVKADGSYNIKLTSGYTYTATLSGTSEYGFEDTNKTVTVGDTDLTNINLSITSKDTIKYTGKITGFDENYARKDNLKIVMSAGVDKVDVTINKADMSFEAILESGVEYTIQLEGVDDYSLKSEATIKLTSNGNKDIEVKVKPTYTVSGKFLELGKTEVTKLSFTRLNDEGALEKDYVYEATVNNTEHSYSVELRDGEYEASAEAAGYETKTHVNVEGGVVTRDLLFIYTDTSPLGWKPDLYVGYDDKEDNYDTVTMALKIAKRMSPSESKRITIHIAPGIYREQITVDVPYVTFKNDSPSEEVKLTWYYGVGYEYYSILPVDRQYGFYDAERAYEKKEKNEVYRWGCTVRVRATDFRAENIIFENSFNRYLTEEEIADGVAPTATSGKPERNTDLKVTSKAAGERAAALYIEDQGDRAEFYNCQFLSNQDTIGTGSTKPHSYFRDCLIEGNTDYICGAGDAVFENCELKFAGYSDASSGGYITAASQPLNYGYLFLNCKVTATTKTGSNKDIGYLGRPWFDPAKDPKKATVTFVNTMLERKDIIYPVGWNDMSGTKPEQAVYKEYNTTLMDGTPADTSERTANTVVTKNPVDDVKVYFGSWRPAHYVDAPASDEKRSEVPMGTEIHLKSATTDAKIYYTTDGKEPTSASTLYADSISLGNEEKTVTIKAIAIKEGLKSSVSTFVYTVVDSDKFVAAPEATPKAGKVNKGTKVTLECDTEGADIYYTTDKSEPTADSKKYEDGTEIVINETTTVKAIAIKGENKSEVVEFEYIVENTPVGPETVKAPTPSIDSGVVAAGTLITLTAEDGTEIYYTINGDDPKEKGELYTDPIAINKTTTIKAIAKKGNNWSDPIERTYTVDSTIDPETVAPPTAKPGSGTVPKGTTVLLECEEGAEIYYIINGDDPIANGELYVAGTPIELGEEAKIIVIKAIAKKGTVYSEPAEFTYTISAELDPGTFVYAPTFSKPEGVAVNGDKVTIDCATEGASIYYTTDGTEPKAEEQFLYTKGTEIVIDKTMTIRAIAVKDGKTSEESKVTYTVEPENPDVSDDPEDPGITDDKKSDIWITGLDKTYYYTGAKIIPDIKVWDCDVSGNDRLLAPGTDYSASYKDNTKVGSATVTITGKGNYTGKKVTGQFTIKDAEMVSDPISVKGAKIELAEKKYAPEYDGTPKNPDFKLVFKGKSPVTYEYHYDSETKQYVRKDQAADKPMNVNIAVANNINKGTATILVTGAKDKNKATSVKATFKIMPVDLSKASVTVTPSAATYAVKGAVPESVKVECNGKILMKGTDYTVKYANNRKVGKQVGTVTITGKGNYTRKPKTPAKFDIDPLDLSKVSVSAVTAYENITAKQIKATVVDGDGNALKASQYKLNIYKEDGTTLYNTKDKTKLAAGTKIYVEATLPDRPKDNSLTGTTPKAEFIVGKNISKAKFKLQKNLAKEYTGKPIELEPKDFLSVTYKDKSGTSELKMNEQFEIVSYSNNINKGTATAVIKGINGYSGTTTIRFKIKQKEMIKGTSN